MKSDAQNKLTRLRLGSTTAPNGKATIKGRKATGKDDSILLMFDELDGNFSAYIVTVVTTVAVNLRTLCCQWSHTMLLYTN
jgi:hypothetical protein